MHFSEEKKIHNKPPVAEPEMWDGGSEKTFFDAGGPEPRRLFRKKFFWVRPRSGLSPTLSSDSLE